MLAWTTPSQFSVIWTALLPYKERTSRSRCGTPHWTRNGTNSSGFKPPVRWRPMRLTTSAGSRSTRLIVEPSGDAGSGRSSSAWREVLQPAQKASWAHRRQSLPDDTKPAKRLVVSPQRRWRNLRPTVRRDCSTCWPTASEFQFPVIFAKLPRHKDRAIALATAGSRQKHLRQTRARTQKERLAKRQANAAVALVRLGMRRASLATARGQRGPKSSQLHHPLAQSMRGRSAGDPPTTGNRAGCDNSPGVGADPRAVYGSSIARRAAATAHPEATGRLRK